MSSWTRSFQVLLASGLLLLTAPAAGPARGSLAAFTQSPDQPGQVAPPGQRTVPPLFPSTTPEEPTPLSRKQKKDLLNRNFEEMKRQADELASLAKSLQQDLDKSNANILSLSIVEKADKIEKLAKKIKGSARGL
jgi:hypothetical protein